MTTVTKKFKNDFEAWTARKMATGDFTTGDVEELRALLQADLADGPDKLREGAAAIHDPRERHRLWSEFFARENAISDEVTA